MEPQFQELAREISEAVESRLQGRIDDFESRMDRRFEAFERRTDTRFEEAAQRTELRMQMHFENVESLIRQLGESYGATLERLDRRMAEMNATFAAKFGDHDRTLGHHHRRITKLEDRNLRRR